MNSAAVAAAAALPAPVRGEGNWPGSSAGEKTALPAPAGGEEDWPGSAAGQGAAPFSPAGSEEDWPGREGQSRARVLERAPGRLVARREDRLCFEEEGVLTLYFFDGEGRLCRTARLAPAPCAPGPSGVQ